MTRPVIARISWITARSSAIGAPRRPAIASRSAALADSAVIAPPSGQTPVAQAEDVAQAVFGDDPAVGDPGDDAAGLVERDQPFGGRPAHCLARTGQPAAGFEGSVGLADRDDLDLRPAIAAATGDQQGKGREPRQPGKTQGMAHRHAPSRFYRLKECAVGGSRSNFAHHAAVRAARR